MAKKVFKMTPAHERFCQAYADTGNATYSYGQAFSGSAYGTCRTEGSAMLTKPDIKERIEQLVEEYKVKYDYDKDKTVRELIIAAEEARAQMQWAPFAKLREMVIKMRGYYEAEKVEHSGEIKSNVVVNYIVPKKENE